jgi:hypothetical protein
MRRFLKYVTAALGLWTVVAITTLPETAALWVAFGTGLAIAALGLFDLVDGRERGERYSPFLGFAGGIIGALIVIGSRQIEGATYGWGAAIGGAVIMGLALVSLFVERREPAPAETVVITVPAANGERSLAEAELSPM